MSSVPYSTRITASSWICPVLILLISGLLMVGRASAHGGGMLQLSGEPAGPYLITVWTSPDPVRVGVLHVTVGVSEPDDGTPILDVKTIVEVYSLDSDNTIMVGQATTQESANKFLYEADFSPPRAGRYLVTVTTNGVQGTGAAQFELEVLSSTAINWATIWLASIVLLFAAVLLVKARIWAPRRDDIICGHDGALDAIAFSAPQALAPPTLDPRCTCRPRAG